MQTTGHLVGVLVKFTTGMQFGHHDFSGTAMELVFFVNVGGNAATIIGNGNRVVGMNGDNDIITIASQGFVNGIVDNFEHHVVKTCAIGCVSNIHAGTFTDSLKALEHFDGFGTVTLIRGVRSIFRHNGITLLKILIDCWEQENIRP